MKNRKKIQDGHELAVLNQFINWLNQQVGAAFEIVERPDPPDAIIMSNGRRMWLEHTDAYRSEEEAKEERSFVTPGEKPCMRKKHPIIDPDKGIAEAIVECLVSKLKKSSYKKVFDEYGPGILIVSERDPLFTISSLERVRAELQRLSITGDNGYFKAAYLCMHMNGMHVFELIYEEGKLLAGNYAHG